MGRGEAGRRALKGLGMVMRVTPFDEPLPCPFCYGEALADKTLRDGCKPDDLEAFAHFLRCRSCGAQGGWAKNPAGAVRCWNMRVEAARLRDELTQARDALLTLRRKRVWRSFRPGSNEYVLLCAECDRPIDTEGNCDGASCPFSVLSALPPGEEKTTT